MSNLTLKQARATPTRGNFVAHVIFSLFIVPLSAHAAVTQVSVARQASPSFRHAALSSSPYLSAPAASASYRQRLNDPGWLDLGGRPQQPLVFKKLPKLRVGGRTKLWVEGGTPPYILEVAPVDAVRMLRERFLEGLRPGPCALSISDAEGRRLSHTLSIGEKIRRQGGRGFSVFSGRQDFQLVGFPFHLAAPESDNLKALLRPALGEMSAATWLVYGYAGVAGRDYEPLGTPGVAVGPGYGFWMAVSNGADLRLEAPGPDEEEVVEIDLHPGWNLVANPFDRKLSTQDIWLDLPEALPVREPAQTMLGHHFWYAGQDLSEYHSMNTLEPLQGAALWVGAASGARIFFAWKEVLANAGKPGAKVDGVPLSKVSLPAGEPGPPALPGEEPAGAQANGGASAAGSGGGCWLSR